MRLFCSLTTLMMLAFAQGFGDEEIVVDDSQEAVNSSEEDNGPIKTPEEIHQQIVESEEQFERAEKMFVPWYTGPLITPSPAAIPPGTMMMQPYVFANDYYAAYNNDRHSKSTPSLVNLNPFVFLQTGLTSWMDISALVQGNVNWLSNQSGGGIGDFVLSPGFLIYRQTRFVPQFKVFIQETFPTGTYDNLDPYKNGLDATGSGSYKTQIGFICGKLVFWQYKHPLRMRLSMAYTIPSHVHVSNFNKYGGGFGTRGTVSPGGTFGTDLGLELSIEQRWVLAMDVVYTSTARTTFSGYKGIALSGGPASIGGPSNDNLSLAPAFEYNWNQNLGIIGGVQFSVYGRNSGNFVSGIISVCYVFNMVK